MAKRYDIVCVTGTYTNAAGEEKNRYQNVGVVLDGDNGPYILLERWFSPAGLPNPDNRTNVLLSLYKPKQKDQPQQQAPQQAPQSQQQSQQAPQGGPAFDDDIPFDFLRHPYVY